MGRFVAIGWTLGALVALVACNPVADREVGLFVVTPIAVGQEGRASSYDECPGRPNSLDCVTDDTRLDEINVEPPGVIELSPSSPSSVTYRGVGPGTATVSAEVSLGTNTDFEMKVVEVFVPDRFEIEAVRLPGTSSGSGAVVPRPCTPPYLWTPGVVAHFTFDLFAGATRLVGQDYSPFEATLLQRIEVPAHPDQYDNEIAFVVGTTTGSSAITSSAVPGQEVAIEVVSPAAATSLTLGSEENHQIWAHLSVDSTPICDDLEPRVATSVDPTVCAATVPIGSTGPGPYTLSRPMLYGPCMITFEVPSLGLTFTRDYTLTPP